MRKRSKAINEGLGQDSFLDIVANLVGILIILVIVVGVRAKDAIVQAQTAKSENVDDEIDVATPTQAASALVQSINNIQGRIKQGLMELKYRQLERDKILKLVALAERQLTEEKDKVSEAQRTRLESLQKFDFAKRRLDDLESQRRLVEQEAAPVAELKHLPTPLAKTVFGKELHFRLQDHRIVFVPWEELVGQFKREVPKKFWKLKEAPSFSDVIGPVQGFRLKYTIVKRQYGVSTSAGQIKQTMAELDHFIIVPTEPGIGEPVERAMQPGSQFAATLSGLKPDRVTLTVWVYPDSFEDFRVLRENLIRRGFITAGRPLPSHRHIGGAPNGTRSMAQ